jgi:hypothetical protein
MKNAIEQSVRQLPILFTSVNGQSKTGSFGVLSMLVKWDAELTNKIDVDETEWDDLNFRIQESEQEHQYFRSLLLEEMISRESSLDKQQLIETVFIYFVRLMDAMFAYTIAEDATNNIKLTAEKICQQFYQTFQFIEEFFGSYINKERKAPAAFAEIDKAAIIKKFKKVKGVFIHQSAATNSLIDIIFTVITDKLSNSAVISINSISYMRQLTKEIERQSKPILEENLRDVLYCLNFNDENFVLSEYERFAALTPDTLGKNERIRLLKQEQKRINQLTVRLNFYWDNSVPPLKEQINGWINEEIQFIELGSSAVLNQNGLTENCDKIQTSLTVAKLAVIVRLLVVDKIIINRQIAPALRTVAKMFTTLQKDEISFGSLETKYHAPDKTTITNVRDMLFKWINILGKL